MKTLMEILLEELPKKGGWITDSRYCAQDGKDLPSIGEKVDIIDSEDRLIYGKNESGEVVAHVENTAVVRMSYGLGCFQSEFLRPARTETERKRESAIEAIYKAYQEGPEDVEEAVYNAIAAGKIPGVKLTD